MFWNNKKSICFGKVERELALSKRFGLVRWRWKRVFFKKLSCDLRMAMNPHVMITGESGSGKSNVCKQLLRQLGEMGSNFVVLDPHSEYVEDSGELRAEAYDASMHSINIFDLDGLSERERSSEITSMFRRIFRLGEVQAYTLYKCISYTYRICAQKGKTPNLHDLLYTIKIFEKHARGAEASTLESLERRLLGIVGERPTKSLSISRILSGRSIISLSSLRTSEAQTVYMESMLKKIYTRMLSGKGLGRFYVVIDEAEKLQNSSSVARLVAEGRKYGIGMIAISQRAKALDKEIRSNAATIIAFAQREPEEQNYVANLVAAGNEYNRFMEVKRSLRELRRGQALVYESRSRNPKIINCTRFEAKRRDPSYLILTLARGTISKRELLGKLRLDGFAEGEALEVIARLVSGGSLKYHVVDESPYEGVWYIAMPRNSAEHDVMVSLISRHLNGLGIRNTIYNSSYGPDIIAYKDGGRVAVEYETGMKDELETRKMLETRKAKYPEIVVVTKDSCRLIAGSPQTRGAVR
jgi:hypothetical protein